jgi:hypothetical protein
VSDAILAPRGGHEAPVRAISRITHHSSRITMSVDHPDAMFRARSEGGAHQINSVRSKLERGWPESNHKVASALDHQTFSHMKTTWRHDEIFPIITRAQSQQGERWAAKSVATTMVAWFSQQITVGKSPWAQRFERIKVDGRWAYRPATTKLARLSLRSPCVYSPSHLQDIW